MAFVYTTSLWIIACAAWDLHARRVPNSLMALGWAVAAVYRVGTLMNGAGQPIPEAGITLLAWSLAVGFWLTSIWGAADAKFLMALTLAFPDLGMLAGMLLVNLLLGLVSSRLASQKSLPAVALLGAGWLAWALVQLAGGGS